MVVPFAEVPLLLLSPVICFNLYSFVLQLYRIAILLLFFFLLLLVQLDYPQLVIRGPLLGVLRFAARELAHHMAVSRGQVESSLVRFVIRGVNQSLDDPLRFSRRLVGVRSNGGQ